MECGQLGLEAVQRPAWVEIVALSVLASVAERAIAAEFRHNAGHFVARSHAQLYVGGRTAHKVKVRAADRACRQPDYSLGRLLNWRHGNIVKANIADAVPNNCFHK